MDYVFASVVSLDCNNSNGLWMYCVLCVDFGCIAFYVWTLDMSCV